ncbi:MAG: hypothetical protein ACU0CI_14280 [Shimia sp.]
MTAYEFWMPLILFIVVFGGGVLYLNWLRARLHAEDDAKRDKHAK